jgi:hypothetical protein
MLSTVLPLTSIETGDASSGLMVNAAGQRGTLRTVIHQVVPHLDAGRGQSEVTRDTTPRH